MEQNQGCTGCGQKQSVYNNPDEISSIKQNSPCKECEQNWYYEKLGTCKSCIALNLIGVVFSWFSFSIFHFFYPVKNLVVTFFSLASLFTILLLLHGTAYLVKKKAK
ncbi:MAG: DUF3624 family protein [Saprospiraceae bacterium]